MMMMEQGTIVAQLKWVILFLQLPILINSTTKNSITRPPCFPRVPSAMNELCLCFLVHYCCMGVFSPAWFWRSCQYRETSSKIYHFRTSLSFAIDC